MELEVDLIGQENDGGFGLDLKLKEKVPLWEDDVIVKLDQEYSDSRFRKSSTEDIDKELEDNFR